MEENKNVVNVDIENNEDNNKKSTMNSKIVPSYAKPKEEKKIIKKGPKSNISKILIVIIIVFIILLLIFGIYKLVDYNTNKKYDIYQEDMKILGFDRMYDNGKSTSYEKVTKSEAVKMIISSVLNIYDISYLIDLESTNYNNENWVLYAEEFELISKDSITKENEDDKISLIEFISILSRFKSKFLSLELDTEINENYKFIDKCSNEEKIALKDMIYNKILVDVTDSTNINKTLSKGQCNQIILNFVKKYNTITINDAKLNINDEKLPHNAKDYPYILANVDKSVYEKKLKYSDVSKSKKPVEIYADIKESYNRIDEIVSEYMDTILNVDYNTIDKTEFSNKLKNVLGKSYNQTILDNYIEFVKSNHIITRGTCRIQYPIIYFDGLRYRVRVKVSYTIDSADKLNSVFYMDGNQNEINYKIGVSDSYYDIILNKDSMGVLYVLPTSLIEMKI